jgi:glycosyltransferase involved in cell wall biosynthesis
MRILHLSMLYPPHVIGGAEKSVAFLAEAQHASGHKVAASCTTPGAAVIEIQNGVRVYRMPHETDFWAEEWSQHSALERGLRRIKMPFNTRLQNHFASVIDDFKPDLVHTHSMTDLSTRAWLAARERAIPIVHTLRDYDLLCAHSSMFKNGERCAKRHLACRIFTHFKKAHHYCINAVVGVGAEILETHIDSGYFSHVPTNLRRVIWNPAVVDNVPANYQKPVLTGPITFGYLGRISIDKGVGKLLEACRQLPSEGWRLLLAGRPARDDEPLINEGKGLPVEFLGFSPAKAFLEQIDVLIAPSIWAEPLPRTILEAYAMGIPALGADSGGIPDLIGRHNVDWLYPATDASALAARMQNILTAGRTKLPGRVAFQHVLDKTTPEMVVHNYEDVYRAVLARND